MYTEKNLPPGFVKLCRSITAKRPRTVIDHLLKHGQISTEELKDRYGYNHPPRAIRDVREQGISLVRVKVKGSDGRSIAAYQFADPQQLRLRKSEGRTALSKQLKEELIAHYGCKCFIYMEAMEESNLQIDHRVPYEVGGEPDHTNADNFMLLSPSANRAKSWSCEHCENWSDTKNREICLSCYWAFPENYSHVAMSSIRRIDLIWQGEEVRQYENLKTDAKEAGMDIPEFVKSVLAKNLK